MYLKIQQLSQFLYVQYVTTKSSLTETPAETETPEMIIQNNIVLKTAGYNVEFVRLK